jgi:hypothetical protein
MIVPLKGDMVSVRQDGRLVQTFVDLLSNIIRDLNAVTAGDNPVPLPVYTQAALPAAADAADTIVIVSDSSVGRAVAWSNGTTWQRLVSAAL